MLPAGPTANRRPKHPPPMKFVRAIVQMVVAGIFAAAETVLLIGDLPRHWHRKQHS